MQRAGLAACALVLATAFGGVARAQTSSGGGGISVGITSFPGRTNLSLDNLGNQMGQPLVSSECNKTITFRFTGIDTSRGNLYFYQGTGCDQTSVRTNSTMHSCIELAFGPIPTSNRSQIDVPIPASALAPCTMGGTGVWNVFVLAMNNPMSDMVSGNQLATFSIAYDFTGPAAPTGFTATGGAAAHLHWDTAMDQVTTYLVYMDPNGCSADGNPLTDGAVATLDGSITMDGGVVDAGMDASTVLDASTTAGSDGGSSDAGIVDSLQTAGPGGAPIKMTGGGSTSDTVPFPSDFPDNSFIAVAIRGVDRSGNPGALSNIVCVQKYPVVTWWDTYCGGSSPPTACGSSSGCSVEPTRTGHPGIPISLVFAALALVFVRRRGGHR